MATIASNIGGLHGVGFLPAKRQISRQAKRAQGPVCAASPENNDHDTETTNNDAGRRSILAGVVGLVTVVAHPAAQAKTTTQPPQKPTYYDELLESAGKKPDTSALLKAYQATKSGKPNGRDKPAAVKPAARPTVKAASSSSKPASKPTAKMSSSSSAVANAASFNPVEVGIGLLLVAGTIVIGSKSTSRAGAGTQRIRTPSRPGTAIKRAPVAPSKTGTVIKRGTVIKSAPTRPGTMRLSPGTKKISTPPKAKVTPKPVVGKRTAKQTKTTAVDSSESPGSGAFIGLGITALALVGLLGGGLNTSKAPAPAKAPTPVVKQTSKAAASKPVPVAAPAPKTEPSPKPAVVPEPAPAAPVVAPKPDAAPKTAVAPEPVPAPAPPVVAPKPDAAPAKASEPTSTTGTNPVVLVGGALVALVAAAAASSGRGGEDVGTGSITAPQSSAGSEEEAAKLRAAEAKAWIEAWRAKQK